MLGKISGTNGYTVATIAEQLSCFHVGFLTKQLSAVAFPSLTRYKQTLLLMKLPALWAS